MKTLALAAALALSAGTASADLLNFGANDLQDSSGGWGTAFSKTYHLHLDAGSWVSGQLFTKSVFGGQQPTVDVQSTLLRQGATSVVWAETTPIDWDVTDAGVEQWSLPTQWFAAGDWELVVSGVSYADKAGEGFDVTVQVPEPASAALVALALAGIGFNQRRRKVA